jgi:hypothetical protein
MHEIILNSGWDTLLFVVPFIGMLLVGFFRLDQLFAAPKSAVRRYTLPLDARPAASMQRESR